MRLQNGIGNQTSDIATAPAGRFFSNTTPVSTMGYCKIFECHCSMPYPEDGVFQFYRDIAIPSIERGDEWHWTIRLKGTPDLPIGVISLHRISVDNRGYWLGIPWQGRGLMTEAVAAVNDYWFDVLGFQVLRAPKAIANESSRRISIKTGMRMIGLEERDFVSGRLMAEIWEINAEEWRQARKLLISGF